jgi:hypothetical protein
MWECSELSDCECSKGKIGKRSPFMRSYSSKWFHRRALNAPLSETVEDHWKGIVLAYPSLNLTLETDKLPALSGVTKQMLSKGPGDEYLAGLWRNTIIYDLGWGPRGASQRPTNYRSPSWSWTSVDGAIANTSPNGFNWCDYAKCINVSVTPSGADRTGEVSAGYIILDASVKIARLETNKDRSSLKLGCKWSLEADSLAVDFTSDCDADFANGSLAIGENFTLSAAWDVHRQQRHLFSVEAT